MLDTTRRDFLAQLGVILVAGVLPVPVPVPAPRPPARLRVGRAHLFQYDGGDDELRAILDADVVHIVDCMVRNCPPLAFRPDQEVFLADSVFFMAGDGPFVRYARGEGVWKSIVGCAFVAPGGTLGPRGCPRIIERWCSRGIIPGE